MEDLPRQSLPLSAGLLLGVGIGGFFDGIVFHQLLRWHHMLSSWYPTNTLQNFELNTLADGLFHSATYLVTLAGLFVLWRSARRRPLWSGRLLLGSMLLGFGLFNLVEGLVDHQLLGVHHVNEQVPPAQRVYWDVAFLASGVVLLAAGAVLLRAGRRRQYAG
jgi:uncharacterized membrane protein